MKRICALAALFFAASISTFAKTKPHAAAGKSTEIREEADRMEYDDRKRTVHLFGHVKVWEGDLVLNGDEVRVDLNTLNAEAKGNVKVSRPGGIVTGNHLLIFYHEKRAEADGSVRLTYSPKGKGELPVHMKGDRLNYDWNGKIARADGNVEFSQTGRRADADHAVYDADKDLLTLDGSVKLFRPSRDVLECDHLVYLIKEDQATATGHVSGTFHVREKGNP